MSIESSGILIDTKLKKIIKLIEWNGCYSVYLKDIDELFWFDDKIGVQEFLNIQARERFYDKELRKGYFEAMNEVKEIFIYKILEMNRGVITKFECKYKED